MPTRRITIFDTTLRDGEQSPGIALQPDEKVEIAAQLERLGVDVIEAGFAISSPGDFEGIRAVAQTVERATVASLPARSLEDVDAAVEALADARRSRLHIVIATSPIHMERKLQLEPAEVLEQAAARGRARPGPRRRDRVLGRGRDPFRPGLPREPSAARRSGPARPRSTCRTRSATACRTSTRRFLREVRRRCPELDRVTLSVHCHNDLGLATANTLAGVAAGAGQVECTVNGIGERAGNAALEEVVMALRVRSDEFDAETGVDVGEIGATSALVTG